MQEVTHLEHLDDFVCDCHDPYDSYNEAHRATGELCVPALASTSEDSNKYAYACTSHTCSEQEPRFLACTI